MNKCLVTTLKASTNNEALSKYNVLTIKTKAVSDYESKFFKSVIAVASNAGGVSINSNNVGIYKSGHSGELYPYPITINPSFSVNNYFENKDGIIEILGKYNVTELRFLNNATLRARELYGLLDGCLNALEVSNFEENEIDATRIVSKMNAPSTVYFSCSESKSIEVINRVPAANAGNFIKLKNVSKGFIKLFDSLTLDHLVTCTELVNIYEALSGNLSSLRGMTKLNFIVFFDNKQCSGDIMDFITPWIQAGRTSGKLKTMYLKNQKNITLNGSPLTFPEGSYAADGACYINWTSDGTVTFTAS